MNFQSHQKILQINLNKDEQGSFGFSLLGKFEGIPHVIYEVNENSPAADEKIEAGDVILKVNGTDVHRFSTKEVLKCLRLSEDPVTLELKRDPNIKDHVRKYLASNANQDIGNSSITSPSSPIINNSSLGRGHRISSSDSSACRKSRIPVNNSRIPSLSAPQSPQAIKPRYQSHIPVTANGLPQPNTPIQKKQNPRFEAYMMTGDLILNLSRTPQSSNLLPVQAKKSTMDSLRDSPARSLKRKNGIAPKAIYDSSPSESSSASVSELGSYENSDNIHHHYHQQQMQLQSSNNSDDIRKASKLSRYNIGDSNTPNESLDEEEEQLIMELSSNNPSSMEDERKPKYNISNEGCANNKSSSSSASSPSNTNSSNSSTNYDGGGGNNHNNIYINSKADQVDFDCVTKTTLTSQHGSSKNQKYSVLHNEEMHVRQQQQQQNNLNIKSELTPSASMSSTTTSSASTTINRSETLDVSHSHSVPTSPTSLSTPLLEAAKGREIAISVPTSPECGQQEVIVARRNSSNIQNQQNGVPLRKCDVGGFRTSRSEDHLQHSQREGIMGTNAIPIDIDEDINSSLNTLLDTRNDSEDSQNSNRDRIVWTYNAPVMQNSTNNIIGVISPTSHSSSISTSPQHTDSPASPTSVSSSVMSSSGSKGNGLNHTNGGQNIMFLSGEQSVSEALSNISSPDYHDENDLLSARDLSAAMAISDPFSDSDSTLIVDQQVKKEKEQKAVIQIPTNEGFKYNANDMMKDSEDELATLSGEPHNLSVSESQEIRKSSSSPPISDDGSDVDSLHSFHYSPKAVDMPSAIRLAKRLYTLDGFKKSDVSRHLSKNNEFSRAVADEYLKYFQFEKLTLDESLRQFLKQFSLSGETQERERVLVHFSKRYLDCNPGTFNSQDAVHTLTCAIMLLNTDLHGQNIGRKMTCSEFIENLSELNDGDNFPKDILKHLYQAIKANPLEWALDDESSDSNQKMNREGSSLQGPPVGNNPFLDIPQSVTAVEYKKGYVMRKCCFDSNNKKTPFGKRSWKMFYCTLRDPLVMYLHKDERGFHKNQLSDNVHNAIRIHHALATKAADYTKKQHVFRLQTSDQSEYLFQTSDSKELQSWIDTINFVCASFSAPALEGGVGSQKRFQRPLLPCSQTKLLLRDQLASHEEQVNKLENTLAEHKQGNVPTKGLALQNYREKDAYLQFELKRYKTYVYLLSSHLNSNQTDLINIIINSANAVATTTTTTTSVTASATTNATPTVGEEDELRSLNAQGCNRKESKSKLKS